MSLLGLAVVPAQAQVLDVVSGDYEVRAEAYAGSNSDLDSSSGSSAADSFAVSVDAAASDFDPGIGSSGATSSSSLNWSLTGTVGISQTLTAETMNIFTLSDDGLAGSCRSYAEMDLRFTVGYTTSFLAEVFGDRSNARFQRWTGGNWVDIPNSDGDPFYAVWHGSLSAGLYRWYKESGGGWDGPIYDYYYEGLSTRFSITAQDPVPEPASMLALSLGAAALLRRRRK